MVLWLKPKKKKENQLLILLGKKGDFCWSRPSNIRLKRGKLTREKGICPGIIKSVVDKMQGNFCSPFLEGDQIGSQKKWDLRDFTLIEGVSLAPFIELPQGQNQLLYVFSYIADENKI